MKIIDRNGRLFGKISIVDVLVIATAALLAVALFVKSSRQDPGGAVPITYQVYLEGARTYLADAIQVGDDVYEENKDTGGSLGVITDIQREEGTRASTFDDGTVDTAIPAEDTVNLILTVEGAGALTDEGYMLNGVYSLGVNSSRVFCTKYALFTGVVTSILDSAA